MTTVFTVCSANYLAHAKTLGDSLLQHNPEYRFVIGLVDCLPNHINSSFWSPYELVPVEDLQIRSFDEMTRKYDLIELNTALKPFYMEYLFQRDPSVQAIIYLDSDILVYGSFKLLEEKLQRNHIVVTPHSCTFDESRINIFYEIGMLHTGIYNLGFIAASRSATTFTFLKWWETRLRDYCYYRAGTGMFTDQIWLTLAPLYFDGIYVEKNPGYNMCYWNHFERHLSSVDDRYVVNGDQDLIFYHFSSYNPERPEVVATRFSGDMIASFDKQPGLKAVYDDYRKRLFDNGYQSVRGLKPKLGRKPPTRAATIRKAAVRFIRELLNVSPAVVRNQVKRVTRLSRRLVSRKRPAQSSEDIAWLLR